LSITAGMETHSIVDFRYFKSMSLEALLFSLQLCVNCKVQVILSVFVSALFFDHYPGYMQLDAVVGVIGMTT
jgi:hypothetical protein